MATMEDIAKKLNISKSTVSKGLSGAADVSETMRKSILEAAVELGYNRTMRRGDAPRFVVFIENMVYESPEDFGYDIILGFRKMAEPDGNEVVIEPLSDMLEKQFDYDTYMLEHNYAGAMFLGMSLRSPVAGKFRQIIRRTVQVQHGRSIIVERHRLLLRMADFGISPDDILGHVGRVMQLYGHRILLVFQRDDRLIDIRRKRLLLMRLVFQCQRRVAVVVQHPDGWLEIIFHPMCQISFRTCRQMHQVGLVRQFLAQITLIEAAVSNHTVNQTCRLCLNPNERSVCGPQQRHTQQAHPQ